jgi:hypothetical protein
MSYHLISSLPISSHLISFSFLALFTPSAVGILPAHGRMAKFGSVEEKKAAVMTAADSFDKEDETEGLLAVGYY